MFHKFLKLAIVGAFLWEAFCGGCFMQRGETMTHTAP